MEESLEPRLMQLLIPGPMMLEIEEKLRDLQIEHNREVMQSADRPDRMVLLAERGRRLHPTHLVRALISIGLRTKVENAKLMKMVAVDPLVRGRKRA